MTDQPRGDESQDNVGTGAEISTENEATAIFYDGSDGVPPSGATPRAPAVSSHSSEAETKASAAAAEAAKVLGFGQRQLRAMADGSARQPCPAVGDIALGADLNTAGQKSRLGRVKVSIS